MAILSFDIYGPEYNRIKTLTPGYFRAMRENGFRLAVLKSSMGWGIDVGCQNSVALLNDYFDIAYYHWCDPTSTAKYQVSFLMKQIETYRPKAVFLDVEQWARNWEKYYAYKRGEISYASVPKLSPNEIVSNANQILELLKDLGLPLEVYTYPYYITELCIGASIPGGTVTGKGYVSQGWWWRDVVWPFPASKRPWIAAYFKTPKEGLRTNTWQGFRDMLAQNVYNSSPEKLTHINLFSNGEKVNYQWWQFASNVWLPSFVNIDMSIFNGGEEEYEAWLSSTPTTPPPPPPTVERWRVKKGCNPNVRVRATSLSAKVGMLTAGTEVGVSGDPVNGWLQITAPLLGWVWADYIEKV